MNTHNEEPFILILCDDDDDDVIEIDAVEETSTTAIPTIISDHYMKSEGKVASLDDDEFMVHLATCADWYLVVKKEQRKASYEDDYMEFENEEIYEAIHTFFWKLPNADDYEPKYC